MLCYLLYDYGVIICDYMWLLCYSCMIMYQCVCFWVHDGTCLGKNNRQNKDDLGQLGGWVVAGARCPTDEHQEVTRMHLTASSTYHIHWVKPRVPSHIQNAAVGLKTHSHIWHPAVHPHFYRWDVLGFCGCSSANFTHLLNHTELPCLRPLVFCLHSHGHKLEWFRKAL